MGKQNEAEAPTAPKDLGLKIGTKDEAAWTLIKDKAEEEIEQSKREIIIDEAIIKIAEKIIAEEKSKS